MKLSIVDLAQVPPGGSPGSAFANSVDLAVAAEQLGYARYWVAEHHGIGGVIANSCPEVIIARIAAATTSIRVGSGSVLLNYSTPIKVAEQFRVLHTLFPDRIDLGIGRASSNSPAVDHALRPRGGLSPDRTNVEPGSGYDPLRALTAMIEHDEQVAEVIAWLDHDFALDDPRAAVELAPGQYGGPQPWVLGASVSSAALAGRLGVAYCYASFINPRDITTAMTVYRSTFRPRSAGPSDRLTEPHASVAVNICCADTDEAADRVRATAEMFHRGLAANAEGPHAGRPRRLLDPDAAIAQLGSVPDPSPTAAAQWPQYLSGSPERVRCILDAIIESSGADEIVLQDLIADHRTRLRSYELIAQICELDAAQRDPRRAVAEKPTRSPR